MTQRGIVALAHLEEVCVSPIDSKGQLSCPQKNEGFEGMGLKEKEAKKFPCSERWELKSQDLTLNYNRRGSRRGDGLQEEA